MYEYINNYVNPINKERIILNNENKKVLSVNYQQKCTFTKKANSNVQVNV